KKKKTPARNARSYKKGSSAFIPERNLVYKKHEFYLWHAFLYLHLTSITGHRHDQPSTLEPAG
ncbi:hypothetical protein ACTXM1_26385, partial [Pseudomonas helleri]|uniref:hypothetical protein n=1 Tax=Pseudomonas helleri TaxID=1608996 RepID=UPI003FD0F0E2